MTREENIIELVNKNSTLREMLGVKDWKNIVKVTSNSVHRFIGINKKGEQIIEARIVCQQHNNIEYIQQYASLISKNDYKPIKTKYSLDSISDNRIYSYHEASSLRMDSTGDLSSDVTGRLGLTGSNYSWATIRGTTTGNNADNSFLLIKLLAGTFNTWSEMFRGGMQWDTSSIGVGSTVTVATIQIYPSSITDSATLNQGINVCDFNPIDDTYENADYGNFGVTAYATAIDLGSLSTSAYSTFTLNSSGRANISLTGDSKFGLRLTGDLTNTEPTYGGGQSASVFVQDTGDANKPLLTVTYTTPTAISNTAVAGVTVPKTDGTPDTTVTADTQWTGSTTWSPSDNPYLAGTEYTATITLVAKAGFTLTGVSANQFTVAGATTATNSADSGVITAVFPKTTAGVGNFFNFF